VAVARAFAPLRVTLSVARPVAGGCFHTRVEGATDYAQ
jgi:hypothetical protein